MENGRVENHCKIQRGINNNKEKKIRKTRDLKLHAKGGHARLSPNFSFIAASLKGPL